MVPLANQVPCYYNNNVHVNHTIPCLKSKVNFCGELPSPRQLSPIPYIIYDYPPGGAAVIFAASGGERDFHLRPCGPRPLLFFPEAPGSRARTAAYFCPAAKVGKNALEPTVQDSLNGQARTRLCPIRGIKDCAVLIGIGEASEFPILRVSNLVAWQSTNSACRPVKGVEPARGTF